MALAAAELPQRLRELRHLAELDAKLAETPAAIAAIEVHHANFAAVLAWLPARHRLREQARWIALLDRSLAADRQAVCDVLVEAGVAAIAVSPRRLSEVVALGVRLAGVAEKCEVNTPFAAQVWAALPWQADKSPVG
jgi:hypothetical protein